MSHSQEHVEIDPRGDLILQVRSDTTEYFLKVSSKVLSVASPVFHRMLEPAFLEGYGLQLVSAAPPFAMELPDDHYASMLTVMNIAHLRMRQIPSTLSLEDFYHLAVVCDKYDLREIFLPWVQNWTINLVKTPRAVACPRWLVISWAFRLKDIFTDVTLEMIFDTPLSTNIGASGDAAVEISVLPTRVIEAIQQRRIDIANTLTAATMDEYAEYKSCMNAKRTVCNAADGIFACPLRRACDTFCLGALMRCLFVCELWPTAQDSSLTIRCIVEEFPHLEGPSISLGRVFDKNHRSCGPQHRLGPVVHEVLSRMKGLQLCEFCQPDDC